MNQQDRFARISLELHGEENISLNFVRCDSSASCAQSSQTNRHPLDLPVVHSLPEQSFPRLCLLLFCDKPLSFRIWIISITVWKRGHIYKYLELRSQYYIAVLFSGNERKARPSEIVIDHAAKVA